jgi:hypothetical protein
MGAADALVDIRGMAGRGGTPWLFPRMFLPMFPRMFLPMFPRMFLPMFLRMILRMLLPMVPRMFARDEHVP